MFYYVELNFFLNILVSKVTGTGNVILQNKIKIITSQLALLIRILHKQGHFCVGCKYNKASLF